MTRTQKIILLCISLIVIMAYGGYLLRGILHQKPEPLQVDSLENLKVNKINQADSNSRNAQAEKQISDEILNSPIDSAERELLWSRIERAAKADSSRRSSLR